MRFVGPLENEIPGPDLRIQACTHKAPEFIFTKKNTTNGLVAISK
jgi:hypothetical protein